MKTILILTLSLIILVGCVEKKSNYRTSRLMAELTVAINEYWQKNGKYPAAEIDGKSFLLYYAETNELSNIQKEDFGKKRLLDQWGNPILYIPYSEYKSHKYALRNEKKYYNHNSFQLRSFGVNGKDDMGLVDDIQFFAVD